MKINWVEIGGDSRDLIASIENGDTLRIERMANKIYWWAVFIGDKQYDCWDYGNAGESLEDAKQQCEELYKKLKDGTKK